MTDTDTAAAGWQGKPDNAYMSGFHFIADTSEGSNPSSSSSSVARCDTDFG